MAMTKALFVKNLVFFLYNVYLLLKEKCCISRYVKMYDVYRCRLGSSPTSLYSRSKKRSSSLQRQELLQIIQANMEKNNLCFKTSRWAIFTKAFITVTVKVLESIVFSYSYKLFSHIANALLYFSSHHRCSGWGFGEDVCKLIRSYHFCAVSRSCWRWENILGRQINVTRNVLVEQLVNDAKVCKKFFFSLIFGKIVNTKNSIGHLKQSNYLQFHRVLLFWCVWVGGPNTCKSSWINIYRLTNKRVGKVTFLWSYWQWLQKWVCKIELEIEC